MNRSPIVSKNSRMKSSVMQRTSASFKVGALENSSALAWTESALTILRRCLPEIGFEIVGIPSSASGDAHFNSDVKDALLRGDIDLTVQNAEALTYPPAEGLRMFRLPWCGNERHEIPPEHDALAVVFRMNDARSLRLRALFVKTVVIAGGGPGASELCTVGAREALEHCDVCLYDSLISKELLEWLPPSAKAVNVGKRAGTHQYTQEKICSIMEEYASRGSRVVRLKGGDPGVFGRLDEEVACLEKVWLHYRVLPGVSSLTAATTGTGLLLTRRNVAAGFTAMTAVGAKGKEMDVRAPSRSSLPIAFFMGKRRLRRIAEELLDDGMDAECPCAVVYNAGREDESTHTGTLGSIKGLPEMWEPGAPAVILVGSVAEKGFLFKNEGALGGKRVLLTRSEPCMPMMSRLVREFGGVPVFRPTFRLNPRRLTKDEMTAVCDYDWIILQSYELVDVLMRQLKETRLSLNVLPKIMAFGNDTADRLQCYRLVPDAVFTGDLNLSERAHAIKKLISPQQRALIVCSDKDVKGMLRFLRRNSIETSEFPICKTDFIRYDERPHFDAALFASRYAVEGYKVNWQFTGLEDKPVAVFENTAADLLREHGINPILVPEHAAIERLVFALAARFTTKKIEACIK